MDGSMRRSLQELSAEVATNPSSTAFVELAAAYRERGDLQRALWLCLRGLQRHPTHVEAHFELARIYELRGELELALDELGIVRQLAPEHIPARVALLRIYLAQGRLRAAERELQSAMIVAPNDPELAKVRQRLRARGEVKEVDPAQSVFDQLVRENPGVLGAMVIDPDGKILAGRLQRRGVEANGTLAANLSGARDEAARVASYLKLGGLRGIIVEGAAARITVSSIGKGAVVVATSSELPPGQATRVRRRVSELARDYLSGDGR